MNSKALLFLIFALKNVIQSVEYSNFHSKSVKNNLEKGNGLETNQIAHADQITADNDFVSACFYSNELNIDDEYKLQLEPANKEEEEAEGFIVLNTDDGYPVLLQASITSTIKRHMDKLVGIASNLAGVKNYKDVRFDGIGIVDNFLKSGDFDSASKYAILSRFIYFFFLSPKSSVFKQKILDEIKKGNKKFCESFKASILECEKELYNGIVQEFVEKLAPYFPFVSQDSLEKYIIPWSTVSQVVKSINEELFRTIDSYSEAVDAIKVKGGNSILENVQDDGKFSGVISTIKMEDKNGQDDDEKFFEAFAKKIIEYASKYLEKKDPRQDI